jgi:hypothetical protein
MVEDGGDDRGWGKEAEGQGATDSLHQQEAVASPVGFRERDASVPNRNYHPPCTNAGRRQRTLKGHP